MNLRERFAPSEDGWRDHRGALRAGVPGRARVASSQWRTATSACAARPRRAPPRTRPAWRSTASTRAGRSCTRRTPTASPAPARRSCGAPDGSLIRLFVDDEPFELSDARSLAFERSARHGDRRAEPRRGVRDALAGTGMQVRSRRLASLEHRHLVAMDYEVVSLDGAVEIMISSELVTHAERRRLRRPAARQGLRRVGARASRGPPPAIGAPCSQLATRNSGLELACGMEHAIESGAGGR